MHFRKKHIKCKTLSQFFNLFSTFPKMLLPIFIAFLLVFAPLDSYGAQVSASQTQAQTAKKHVKSVKKQKPTTKYKKVSRKSKKTFKNQRIRAKNQSKKKLDVWHYTKNGTPPLRSKQALVISPNGKVLFEKNADHVQPIASVTKLMTAMVVLDADLDMNEVIEITQEDADRLKGTKSRLKVGTRMSRTTALLLALMSSENRAAHALGRHYPGGLKAFVDAMNEKALSLGMLHTFFVEPTGLSRNNISNAHDLAQMVLAAAQYPEIRYFSTMVQADVAVGQRVQSFHNTNGLVDSAAWDIGISKTGYISAAGRCLVMSAVVANKPVVIVLLNSVGKRTREGDANRIKTWMENRAQLTALNK